MTSEVQTSWIAPPHQIGGLDHLGVQAPCITIYGTLLPGITNVTDRARYYTFYPWLFYRFEKEGWRSPTEISTMLRKAECLLTLISIHHGISEGGRQETHRAAMVGNDVLTGAIDKIEAGKTVSLSTYANKEESTNRYFMNPFGGLAQYYFGALKLLKLMDGETAKEAKIPKETGARLAETLDNTLPGDLFIETLINEDVKSSTLKSLHPFCACQLKHFKAESEILINILQKGWTSLFLDGTETAEDRIATAQRAQSIALICLLADTSSESNNSFNVLDFRGLIYSGHNHNGEKLKISEGLADIYSKWQTYQRNELLSIALQGLFYAVLRANELANTRFNTTQELSEWFWDQGPGTAIIEDTGTLGKMLEQRAKLLPAFGDWNTESHEIQSMNRVNQLTGQSSTSSTELTKITEDSLSILSAILFRQENTDGYGDFSFIENYLNRYPVNLTSVRLGWEERLSAFSPQAGLILLVKQFCLDAHLKVAMRKLRQQGRNTFRFELGEHQIAIKDIPQAAQTSPRFRQTLRILIDLDLLQENKTLIHTTERGKQFLGDFQ